MIEVKEVKEFNGLKVLNGIDYKIKQGEDRCRSDDGSGKEVRLRCLNLEEPTKGRGLVRWCEYHRSSK